MLRLLLLAVLMIAGCTAMSDLKPVPKQQYVVLEQPFVRERLKGAFKDRWLEGLQPGVYSAVGEDKDGTYFKCESNCVVQLLLKKDQERPAMNEVVAIAEKETNRFPQVLSEGGLWLPKASVAAKPRIFWLIKNSSQAGSNLGITGAAIVSMTEGTIVFLPLDGETHFLSSLTVKDR